RIESSSGGEMPALLNATSSRPCRCTTPSKSARTCASSATSQAANSPPTSPAADSPASALTSTTTTVAPSAANRRTVASPMPLPPPVTTATRSRNRSVNSILRVDEDVLHVGERGQRVRAEFAPEAGLLHAAERRPVPHRGVRVDAQRAGLDRPGHPQRPAQVAGPQRSGQPVLGVVGHPDRVRLALERQHG